MSFSGFFSASFFTTGRLLPAWAGSASPLKKLCIGNTVALARYASPPPDQTSQVVQGMALRAGLEASAEFASCLTRAHWMRGARAERTFPLGKRLARGLLLAWMNPKEAL